MKTLSYIKHICFLKLALKIIVPNYYSGLLKLGCVSTLCSRGQKLGNQVCTSTIN
jgi:hypothetical protein